MIAETLDCRLPRHLPRRHKRRNDGLRSNSCPITRHPGAILAPPAAATRLEATRNYLTRPLRTWSGTHSILRYQMTRGLGGLIRRIIGLLLFASRFFFRFFSFLFSSSPGFIGHPFRLFRCPRRGFTRLCCRLGG